MKFTIRKKLLSIKDDFSIESDKGTVLFTVSGSLFSLPKKLNILNKKHESLCYIRKKPFKIPPQFDIFISGEYAFTVQKIFKLATQQYIISDVDDTEYDIKGNIPTGEFVIYKNSEEIAVVSRKFMPTFFGAFGVSISKKENVLPIMAMLIAIRMSNKRSIL